MTRTETDSLRKKNKSFERDFYKALLAIAWQESRFDRNAIGQHGELGAFQIKPKTAIGIIKKYNLGLENIISELGDFRGSSIIAAYYLIDGLKIKKSLDKAIMIYNQGLGVFIPSKKDTPEKVALRMQRAKEYHKEIQVKVAFISKHMRNHEENSPSIRKHRIRKNNDSQLAYVKGAWSGVYP